MTTNTDSPRDPSKSLTAAVIGWSAQNRFLVLLGSIVLLVAGILAVQRMALDAVPDLSDTQVIIRTQWPGQAPQVIEDQITFPLSSRMLGLPQAETVRGFSMFGDSFLYVVFKDGTDLYWARSRVLEALSQTAGVLPDGVRPQLGPDATGVGWIFQYALVDRTGRHDLQQLRALQDWFLRYELAAIDGVAEIASVGGFVKEYQVLVDPHRLHAYGIPLQKVITVIRAANQETGGRTIEMGEAEYMIRSFGYLDSVRDLEQAVLQTGKDGVPVTIADIGRVVESASIRRGITELNGEGEAVGGIVVMRSGANAHQVIKKIRERMDFIKNGLPEGIEIVTVYDRSTFIDRAVDYLAHKLLEESLIVAFVVFLFLLHLRSALVVIITLPLGILAAFVVMEAQGITANIMSLGGIAIAIGAMVDAAIVMVENGHRKLAELPAGANPLQRRAALLQAAQEVGPGIFFSLLIIAVSFLPVLALTGQSHRLFAPLVYTKTYAMAAAAVLSVTLVPVLMMIFMRGKIKPEERNPFNRFLMFCYRPVLDTALRFRKTTLILALCALISTAWPLGKTGSEFMPPLDEGSLLYMPMTLPGVSPAKVREILQVTNRQLMSVPEVRQVFAKAGRSDSATDPAPLAMLETWIALQPPEEWREGMTTEKLMAELDKTVRLPGMRNVWGYPIKIRTDMMTTGIRTPVGIKISGQDLKVIDRLAKEIETQVLKLAGTRSALADRVQGGKYIEIIPDRKKIARYGIAVGDVQMAVQTLLGGMMLDEAVEGRARYPVALRYDRADREHIEDLGNILISAPSGAQIPLADMAEIKVNDGPAMITSEDARLNGWVFVDIRDTDIGHYINDLTDALKAVKLPQGYSLKIAGQFEQMREARQRLGIAVPAALLTIITLLYLYFRRWDRVWMLMLSIPFGLAGGFWWVWIAGYNFSVAVAVGFVALAGIAAETAVVMMMYIDHEMRAAPPSSVTELLENIRRGAVLRLRPKLMTAGTVILGLVPVFLTDGAGADVMRRIALPMVGGMISTTLLTLIVLPVIYAVYMRRKLKL